MSLFIQLFILVFIYMSLGFVYSLLKGRNDVADIAWGLGFVVIAWASFIVSTKFSLVGILTNLLVTVWGLRLALHIYKRNKNKPEDYRYAEWRRQWGKNFFIRSYLQVFLLQGLFMYLISIPVIVINNSSNINLNLIGVFGVLVWLLGFYFESVSDKQLADFIKNSENKGKIMNWGLWKYSRHPNYFGEVTQWWGIYVIALNSPLGWLSIIGPLTITFLILKVSGIPLLESKMMKTEAYVNYAKKTNKFIPWFPKQ